MKLCKDCKVKPCKQIKPCASKPNQHYLPRCVECNRRYQNSRRFKVRQRTKQDVDKQNRKLIEYGFKICIECKRKKQLTEFGTSLPHRQGVINNICDTCLTKHYKHNNKDCDSFTPKYWRKKAYSCNTTARNRLMRMAKRFRKDKLTPISLKQLNYECKPQDLANLFKQQQGRCRYCNVTLTVTNLQVDHAISLGANGRHVLSNLVLACGDCNFLKRKRTAADFIQFLQIYARRILAIDILDKEPV